MKSYLEYVVTGLIAVIIVKEGLHIIEIMNTFVTHTINSYQIC